MEVFLLILIVIVAYLGGRKLRRLDKLADDLHRQQYFNAKLAATARNSMAELTQQLSSLSDTWANDKVRLENCIAEQRAEIGRLDRKIEEAEVHFSRFFNKAVSSKELKRALEQRLESPKPKKRGKK